ncbi:MraY family glycosyltransferase [Lysobacter fragariae]
MTFWLFLNFTIAFIGTWLARRYALQRNLVDHPGERRAHVVPTPRGGGIAIVVALLVATCALAWRYPQQIVLLAAYLIGMVAVAAIGWLDDHRPLSAWVRLGVQAIAAGVLALGVAATWGDLLLAIAAFVAVMVLTNVWNFMDGIDGIAASQAALVAGGLSVLGGGAFAWLGLALVAGCLGFLPFNFPRARIFLGDVGSGALGFTLAALLIVAAAGMPRFAWLLLLLPLSAFLVDSGLTLARRVLRGERWWTAHAQHAYQAWAARSGTHAIVTFAYAGWTAVAWLLAWGLQSRPTTQAKGIALAWLVLAMALWWALQYSCRPGKIRIRTELEKDGE